MHLQCPAARPCARTHACRHLLAQLQELHAQVDAADADAGSLRARLPTGSGGFDELQLQLTRDGLVLFKSQASENRPDPPFCLTRGCISGPSNRARLEALRDALGWTAFETDEDKVWVQVLLH